MKPPASLRSRLRRSFDRAAANFEEVAVLPREIANRMFERLSLMRVPVRSVLDAGCGTGQAVRAMQQRYRGARIIELDLSEKMLRQTALRRGPAWPWKGRATRRTAICADVQQLPLAAETFDLIWSNLALHWVEDLPAVFAQMLRVLRPGGLLMFSLLGPDTLRELRIASVEDAFMVNQLVDMHDIGDMLVDCGYSDPVMDMETMTLTYADARSLLRDLRAHGSICLKSPPRDGLGGRQRYQQVLLRYERFRNSEARVPATFEIVYGHAWKPQTRLSPRGQRVIDIQPARK